MKDGSLEEVVKGKEKPPTGGLEEPFP